MAGANRNDVREVEARNRLRADAHLPLLDIDTELAQLAKLAREQAYATFLHENKHLYFRIRKHLINCERIQRRDPEWMPTGCLSGGAARSHDD
jgi:hypothetical protein